MVSALHYNCALIFFSYCSYDSTTGVFTVPPGGDGIYYFSVYLLVQYSELGLFDTRLNNDVICTADGDHDDGGFDYPAASCSAVMNVIAGNIDLKCIFYIQNNIYLPAETKFWPR